MREVRAEVNTKGMLLFMTVIIGLTFALGFLANRGADEMKFNEADVEEMSRAIEEFDGDSIVVSKNKRGDLTVTIKK